MQFKIGTMDLTSRLRHEVSTLWRCLQYNRIYATLSHDLIIDQLNAQILFF